MAFTDLDIPVSGIPIQVIRSYDSRDKRQGDFGFGWTLSVNSVRLQKSGVPGATWKGVTRPGFFPHYCVSPIREKRITVTLPNNEVHSFTPKLDPECSMLVPPQEGTLTFVPQPGTTSTLRPYWGDYVMLNGGFPGPFDLVDADSGDAFDASLWVLTLHDGRELVVDDKGKVQSITDLHGNMLSFGPDGITHSSGKSVTFERDNFGRLSSIIDPMGVSIRYEYDSRGDLTSVTDREQATTGFTYQSDHLLLDIIDPRGVRAVRNDYDVDGRLISHTDPFGKTIQYDHDIVGRVESVTDRLGHVTTHVYDERGNVLQTTDALGGVTSRTYDARDNKMTETNPLGHTTSYTYNDLGDVLTVTDPLGHVTHTTYDALGHVLTETDALGRTTTSHYTGNRWDRNLNLAWTMDASGAGTGYGYDKLGNLINTGDALGQQTRYSYDRFGNQVTETDALGHVTTYEHDDTGNRVSMTRTRTTETGVETLTTRYVYDAQSRVTRTVYPDGSNTETEYNVIGKQSLTRDQLGRETLFMYDDAGRLTKTSYPDGHFDETTYDDEGRRKTTTDRAGRTTTYAYDVLGRLTRTTFVDGTFRSTAYDAAGRVLSETDERGNITLYEYDDAGRRTRVIDPLLNTTVTSYDAAGQVVAVTDANSHTTAFEYDQVGRRVKTIFADSNFRTTGYDLLGRRISETDEAGKVTQYGYDALGKLTSVTDALAQVTSYGYDEVGNQVSQTDANLHTTTFGYDKMGRRSKRTLPLGMFETLAYDAAGRMATKTDFNGFTTSYEYDVLGRLTTKTPDPRRNEPSVRFFFNVSGQRSRMEDASGVTTYQYDSRDRLVEKAAPAGTLTYTYDASGNVASIRSSNVGGTDVQYTWDENNRLHQVIDARAGTFTYSYDGVGSQVGLTYPNGIVSTTTYDNRSRLLDLRYTLGADVVASYTYTLAATGHRTGVVEHTGRSVGYGYDDLYRLVGETVSADPHGFNGSVGYVHDPVGNRLARTSTLGGVDNQSFTYNANDQLDVEEYDLRGNVVRDAAGNSFAWDLENHLVSSSMTDAVYVFDGDGNRVAKGSETSSVAYVTDDGANAGLAAVAESVTSGQVFETYVHGLNFLGRRTEDFLEAAILDGVGSRRGWTSESLTVSVDYDAFGLATAGDQQGDGIGFAGQWHDSALDLTYFRARYLQSATGRFLGVDPGRARVADARTLHVYLYAAADPVNLRDPSGRSFLESAHALAVNATIYALGVVTAHPVMAVVLGGAAAALMPAEFQTALELNGFPGMAQIGAVGRAEVRLFRLVKHPGVKQWITSSLGRGGNAWGTVGHSFEDWCDRYLIPGAAKEVKIVGARVDRVWKGLTIEIKSGGFDATDYQQLDRLAAHAQDTWNPLVYIFLEHPGSAAAEKIVGVGGTVISIF